jgi:hypothetical protein
MILFFELIGTLAIVAGLFLISIPTGLISIGLSILLFTFAIERGQRKAK